MGITSEKKGHLRAERRITMRRRVHPADNNLHDLLVVLNCEIVHLAPTDVKRSVEMTLQDTDFEEGHDGNDHNLAQSR